MTWQKRNWRPFWANRWWVVALGIAWVGYWNALLNHGYIVFQGGNTTVWYYFGGDPGVWGLVTGLLAGQLYSKVKANVQRTNYIIHQHSNNDKQNCLECLRQGTRALPERPAMETEP